MQVVIFYYFDVLPSSSHTIIYSSVLVLVSLSDLNANQLNYRFESPVCMSHQCFHLLRSSVAALGYEPTC